MPESTTAIASAMSAATTGPTTPSGMSVTRPTKEAIYTIAGAMLLLAVMAAGVTAILAAVHWPDGVAPDRVKYLGWMGLSEIACIAVLVVAIASSRLGNVKATAGPTGLSVDLAGRPDPTPPPPVTATATVTT